VSEYPFAEKTICGTSGSSKKNRRVDRSKRMASLQRKLTSAEEKRHLEHVCLEIKLAVRSFLARADAQRIPTISFTANRRGRLVLRV
jgi:hypothetical protein